MGDYLKVITPYLQSDLVSPDALSEIRSLARILPPLPLAFLECRLGYGKSRVDFQVNVSPLSPSLPEILLKHPTWQTFQKIYQEWTEEKSFLYQKVRNIWLEFDVYGQSYLEDTKLNKVPVPCTFLTLNNENITNYQELIKIVFSLLNYPISSQIKSNIQLSIDCLTAKSHISHIGLMLSRSVQEVRINVNEIAPAQVLDYLRKIGWTDPTNTLQSYISNLSEFVDGVCLSFDIGDKILPRIGLECSLVKQPKYEPRWKLFLDYLVEKGLCTPGKQKALLTWPGLCQKASIPDNWPSNLIWGDIVMGANVFSIFKRRINHIKLVYQPNTAIEAKAYLGFSHNWLDIDYLNTNKLQIFEV
ncbi:MAG: hypothetical protein V7K47_31155 [Nostoc sp.]